MAELKQLKLTDLENSVLALERALSEAEGTDEQRRNSTLMCFAFASEMAWKYLKVFLTGRGVDLLGSKDAYRYAQSAEIIDESTTETLLAMVPERNRLVHEYNLAFADELFPRVRDAYAPALRRLYNGIAAKAQQ